MCDLEDNKKVSAVEGSTSLDNIKVEAEKCGFELGDRLVVFRRHDDAAQALLEGGVDAFTSDAMALRAYAAGQAPKVVGKPFSEEPYGFAVAKGDARLLDLIDRTLREMERDGTYAAIYAKWFGDRHQALSAGRTGRAGRRCEPRGARARPGRGCRTRRRRHHRDLCRADRPGDTLSRIARKYYGPAWASSWQRIYEAKSGRSGRPGPPPGRDDARDPEMRPGSRRVELMARAPARAKRASGGDRPESPVAPEKRAME